MLFRTHKPFLRMQKMMANSVEILGSQHLLRVSIFIVCNFAYDSVTNCDKEQ